MKTNLFLIISIIFVLSIISYPAQCWELRDIDQIVTDIKSITLINGFARVKETWKKFAASQKVDRNKPPRVNTVSITCNKDAMTCIEIIAGIVTPKDHRMDNSTTFLNIEETNYAIVQWTNDLITAKNTKERVSDFELKISLRDNTAERKRQETKARGCAACDPSIFERWILE